MAKKLHWTQRPENKEKLAHQLRKAIAAKTSKSSKKSSHKFQPQLLDDLDALRQKAHARILEIDKTLSSLESEKAQLEAAFPMHLSQVEKEA